MRDHSKRVQEAAQADEPFSGTFPAAWAAFALLASMWWLYPHQVTDQPLPRMASSQWMVPLPVKKPQRRSIFQSDLLVEAIAAKTNQPVYAWMK
jgi:hypothetical protein